MNQPTAELAARVRDLVIKHGDRRVSARLHLSRTTVIKLSARLPVLPAVLLAVEAQLSEVEHTLQAAA
jgi:hypothetical protein